MAICLTDWSVGIETEAIFALEKVREGEIIGGRPMGSVGAFVTEVHLRSSTVVNCNGLVAGSRYRRADVEDFGNNGGSSD